MTDADADGVAVVTRDAGSLKEAIRKAEELAEELRNTIAGLSMMLETEKERSRGGG
jgi:hypothetical protein